MPTGAAWTRSRARCSSSSARRRRAVRAVAHARWRPEPVSRLARQRRSAGAGEVRPRGSRRRTRAQRCHARGTSDAATAERLAPSAAAPARRSRRWRRRRSLRRHRAPKQGRRVVLFWNAEAADDSPRRGAIRDLDRHGGKVAVHVVPIGRVGRYHGDHAGVSRPVADDARHRPQAQDPRDHRPQRAASSTRPSATPSPGAIAADAPRADLHSWRARRALRGPSAPPARPRPHDPAGAHAARPAARPAAISCASSVARRGRARGRGRLRGLGLRRDDRRRQRRGRARRGRGAPRRRAGRLAADRRRAGRAERRQAPRRRPRRRRAAPRARRRGRARRARSQPTSRTARSSRCPAASTAPSPRCCARATGRTSRP